MVFISIHDPEPGLGGVEGLSKTVEEAFQETELGSCFFFYLYLCFVNI